MVVTDRRLKGWEKRFIYMVEEELALPFDDRLSSCGDLVAVAIMACRGPTHPALDILRQYKEAKDQVAWLTSKGGMLKILSGLFEEIPWMYGQTADLGVVETVVDGQRVMSGIILVDGVAVGKDASGVIRFPIDKLHKVFKV